MVENRPPAEVVFSGGRDEKGNLVHDGGCRSRFHRDNYWSKDGRERVNAYCRPDLRLHRVLGCSIEMADANQEFHRGTASRN
jgi:hypothetical protein